MTNKKIDSILKDNQRFKEIVNKNTNASDKCLAISKLFIENNLIYTVPLVKII